jgi:hypothetical protein
VTNSFERKIDDESLGKRAFEPLNISQLIAAIAASGVQPEVADTSPSVVRLWRFRGGARLHVFLIARDQYVLMQVTSSSTCDEGSDYLGRNTDLRLLRPPVPDGAANIRESAWRDLPSNKTIPLRQ